MNVFCLASQPPVDYYKYKLGKPQLGVMTISGNDLGFPDIINECVYYFYGYPNCENALKKAEDQLDDITFANNLINTLIQVVLKGREGRGVTPPEAFQLYIAGYIPFWNDDAGCDTVSWRYYGETEETTLTRARRNRMNLLVDKINFLLKVTAWKLKVFGIIYVEGINVGFDGHRYCEPGSNVKKPISKNTLFWALDSPWLGGGEGPDVDPQSKQSDSGMVDTILNTSVPDPNQRTQIKSGQLEPYGLNPAFNDEESFYAAVNALQNSSGPNANTFPIPDNWRRIFHPKGTGYGLYKDAFMQAIVANWQATPPSESPPPAQAAPTSPQPEASDICGAWYKVVFDRFEVRGRNFDLHKFGKDGAGLEQQIKGCGALTGWKFEWTPNDPRFQWFASGDLPIGTKACIGRAVVSAGGGSADGCTGAG